MNPRLGSFFFSITLERIYPKLTTVAYTKYMSIYKYEFRVARIV